MTSTGAPPAFARSSVGKRYVENTARSASSGDDRRSDRASGNPDSRMSASGRFRVDAYAAIAVPSERPQYTTDTDVARDVSGCVRTASTSRYKPSSDGRPVLTPYPR